MSETQAEAFLRSLLRAMPTAQARMALLLELGKWHGVTIYLPMPSKADRRQRAAEHMLANGAASTDAAAAIKERFGVCARTAQRDVAAALGKMSSKNCAIAP
jgi:hypothetical protein